MTTYICIHIEIQYIHTVIYIYADYLDSMHICIYTPCNDVGKYLAIHIRQGGLRVEANTLPEISFRTWPTHVFLAGVHA